MTEKKTWNDQFRLSVEKWRERHSISDDGVYSYDFDDLNDLEAIHSVVVGDIGASLHSLERDKNRMFDSFLTEPAMLAIYAHIGHRIHHLYEPMVEAIACCESPIEDAMLIGLFTAASERFHVVQFRYPNSIPIGDDPKWTEPGDTGGVLIIEPQAVIGKYRVDFLLELGMYDAKHFKDKDGNPRFIEVDGTSRLIIECDGHDFHDRTKRQASSDRKKDRSLQSTCGIPVFRYTGSDLWADVMAQADDALDLLYERTRENLYAKCYALDEHVAKEQRRDHESGEADSR